MKNQKVKGLLSLVLAASMILSTGFTSLADEVEEVESESVLEEMDEVILNTESDATAEEEEESEPVYADDESVRVFIVFDDESVVDAGYSTEDIADNKKAMKYSDKLEDAQEDTIEQIEAEVDEIDDLDTRYSFTILTNAVSANVPYGAIEEIEEVEGVEAVYIAPVYEVQATSYDTETITSGDMVGSYNTWTSGYTGAGRRIAIIDTGIDSDHPSFDGDAFMYSLEETAEAAGKTVDDYNLLDTAEIDSALSSLNASNMYSGLTADDVYVSSKIAYAFNYVDENLDITHDNDSEGDHGTHVAGIATANQYVPSGDGYEKQESGVVGVAPDAQLLVMKVFGTAGGAYTDDYMAAIEDAIVLGADAINLSLGSSSAGESADSEAYVNEIMTKLQGTDTIVSISAGNSGYWAEYSEIGYNFTSEVDADTVGSPGSYTNALTVASAVNSGYTGYAALFDGESAVYYDDGSSANNAAFKTLDTNDGAGTEYEYVLIDGVGNEEDLEGLDLEGKILIVKRGSISFYVKHMNGAAAGAAGVLVYNNTTGTISMSLSGSTATIPCASITLSDAEAIKANATYDEETGAYTGKVVVSAKVSTNYEAEGGYSMSDFSSWGVPGSLELKPEITAPGGNIYSTLTDGEYGLMSGTSMAAPSVTGLSALVLQYIEENDLTTKTGLSARTLAQSLLMSTSIPLVEEDGEEYSPRKQGSGLANSEYATTSDAYILVGDKEGNDGKVKAELGDDPNRTGSYSFDFDVYSLDGAESYYTTSSSVLTESVLYDCVIANSSYELSPEVTITADETTLALDVDQDGDVDSTDASELLAYVAGSEENAYVANNESYFDFNNDGAVNTYDVRQLLLAVEGKTSAADITSQVVAVTDKTNISVNITLSDEDKAYIDENFENGIYVEGFIYLNGNVDLSIPFLAFYGNWTDSSMFEPFDYLEYANSDEETQENDFFTYTGVGTTNYLTYKFAGNSKTYLYASNMYASDDEYMAERNALSSENGNYLGSFAYTLIRNASDINVQIVDVDTDEVYYSYDKGAATGAFYYSSNSAWMNTMSSLPLNWAGTDADGEPLDDGTEVKVVVTALPSYYDDGKKVAGDGATIEIPFVIDNEAPYATYKASEASSEDGLTIAVQDNNYVAAVYVYDSDKTTLLNSYSVNQTTKDEATDIVIESPETVFYMTVIDYAGNSKTYRVNNSGQEDTKTVESISLDKTSVAIMKGNQEQLTATLLPVTLTEAAQKVVWTSSDETVATVDENGIVTAVEEGTCTITCAAKTKKVGENYAPATCEVTVFNLDKDLDAIVWDENGEVYFSSFNTAELPEYTKVSDEQSFSFWSDAVVGDKLVASTYNKTQSASDYYYVDPETFETTYMFSSYWNTDMAYGEASEYLFGTYGYYVVVSDLTDGMLGVFNLSSKMDGDDLVGITYVGTVNNANYGYIDFFYLIDDAGNIYQMAYYVDYSQYAVAEIGSTGISTNGGWYYDSLYYDADTDFLFYSCYNTSDEVTIYAISESYDSQSQESTFETYTLGNFDAGVWPISGLYTYSSAAATDDTIESFETVTSDDRMSFEATTDLPELATGDMK